MKTCRKCNNENKRPGRVCGKWHIDHIIPLCSFDLTNINEFKIAVNYMNLQPLWAIDNLKKGSKSFGVKGK